LTSTALAARYGHGAFIEKERMIRLEDHMHLLISSPPSPTATSSCCPQCAAVMSIRLVEPDLKDPLKARHVFECQECGVSRAYLMIADELHSWRRVPTRDGQWDTR
jgi:hypothetical protein